MSVSDTKFTPKFWPSILQKIFFSKFHPEFFFELYNLGLYVSELTQTYSKIGLLKIFISLLFRPKFVHTKGRFRTRNRKKKTPQILRTIVLCHFILQQITLSTNFTPLFSMINSHRIVCSPFPSIFPTTPTNS